MVLIEVNSQQIPTFKSQNQNRWHYTLRRKLTKMKVDFLLSLIPVAYNFSPNNFFRLLNKNWDLIFGTHFSTMKCFHLSFKDHLLPLQEKIFYLVVEWKWCRLLLLETLCQLKTQVYYYSVSCKFKNVHEYNTKKFGRSVMIVLKTLEKFSHKTLKITVRT